MGTWFSELIWSDFLSDITLVAHQGTSGLDSITRTGRLCSWPENLKGSGGTPPSQGAKGIPIFHLSGLPVALEILLGLVPGG